MKEVPALTLLALFDAASAVEGAQLTLFAHTHPEAADALRAWAKDRGHALTEYTDHVAKRGAVTVIAVRSNVRFDISVQIWNWPTREAA